MDAVLKILGDLPMYLGLITGVFASVLAVALVIPGEQPDKFLQSGLDFIKKLSIK